MNLKQKLSKKLKKSGGFTLIEMLIVVAIIAILVAVSIPMVNSSLTSAKQATDDANERAAKAAAIADYLMNNTYLGTEKIYYYNAKDGTVTTDTSKGDEIAGYSQNKAASSIVKITIGTDGSSKTEWIAAGSVLP